MNKILLIVLIVVAIAAIGLGVLWMKTSGDKKKVDAELASVSTEYAAFKDEKTKVIAGLESAKQELEDAKDALAKQIKTLETKMTDIEAKTREAVTAELDELNDKLNAADSKAKELAGALAAAQKDVTAKEALVAARDKTIADKDGKIGELTQSVTDWQAKEKAAADLAETYKNRLLENKIALEPDKQFRGNILVINAEQEFLMLDLGSDDLLPVGTKLKVVRDNHLIGTIEIKKLLPEQGKLSVAVVESLIDPANTVREGDQVKN